jgi:exopolyphosphatase/guanosine-5'-triphosphate,3'-diphosphate pyrophosphatase
MTAHSHSPYSAYPNRSRERGMVYAALDLGTNNCRLLIAGAAQDSSPKEPPKNHPQLHVLDSFSRIVRLGEGVIDSGQLSDAAMERTLEALVQCQKKLGRFPNWRGRFVATDACRRAANSKDFLLQVQQHTGLAIDIISTEEEAGLAFRGCASLLKKTPRHALMIDIGGGSTEFMWVEVTEGEHHHLPLVPHHVHHWFSLPYGVMNLSEKFGGAGVTEIYFEEMVRYLSHQLHEADTGQRIAQMAAKNELQLLSTSGTVTTLAAIFLGLQRYERARIDGITLGTDKIRQSIDAILQMRASERFYHPCIGSERSDYIITGCAIFEAICRVWAMKTITIADRGVREGIILSLLAEHMHG